MPFDHVSGRYGRRSFHVGTSFVVLPFSNAHSDLADTMIRRLLIQGADAFSDRATKKACVPNAKAATSMNAITILIILDFSIGAIFLPLIAIF